MSFIYKRSGMNELTKRASKIMIKERIEIHHDVKVLAEALIYIAGRISELEHDLGELEDKFLEINT